MSRFALNKVPRVSSKTQLFLTCFSMILMNSEIIASGLPYSEPPSFKIGEKIRLETILSCGTGAFQNKQDSVFWCDSMKEDDSNQTNGNQSDTCSACDPLTNASYSIKSVLTGNGVREWRSLPKDKESILQELNITINFPQVLEIQSVSVKAGKTPLPAVWALETTLDVNSDFQGVRYYVKNQEDCLKHFGVSLLDSPVCHLQSERSWTESKTFLNHLAASVQLRFLKMWPVVEASNNYSDYYSISDISIEGRCVCNGHTDECSPTDDGRMACHCRHNTCGERCQFCCEGYSRDDNGDCEGRPKNTSKVNSNKTSLAHTTSVTRHMEESERSSKVISTTDNFFTRTALHTTAKTFSGSITVKSSAAPPSGEMSAVSDSPSTAHDRSTVSAPSTVNVAMTRIPNEEKRLSSLAKTAAVTTPEDKTTVSIAGKTSAALFAVKNDTVPSSKIRSSVPTVAESNSVYPTKVLSLLPPTVEIVGASISKKNATVSTSKENTIFPDSASSHYNTTIISKPKGNTMAPSSKDAKKMSTLSTTVKTNSLATTDEISSMTATIASTSLAYPIEASVVSNKENNTLASHGVFTTVATTVENTTMSIIVENTTRATIVKNTSLFTVVRNAAEKTTTVTEVVAVHPTTKEVTTQTTTMETNTEIITVADKSESPRVEITTEPTIVESTTGLTTTEVTSVATTLETTESITLEATTMPNTEESTTVPTSVETMTDPTTVETTIMPTTMETTKLPNTVETKNVPITTPTIVEKTTEPATLEATTMPNTVKTTTVSSTMETMTDPTTTETTTVSTTIETTKLPNTVETKNLSITMPATVETTTNPTILEATTMSNTVEKTIVPTTVETTTDPTTVETTAVPTTMETTNVSTSLETTIKSTTVESTTLLNTVETSTVPTTVETTTESTILEATTMPNTVGKTTVPTTVETTTDPTTAETTTVPTTVETTTAPTSVETTIKSTTVESATLPNTVETSTVPTTVETTTVPTTMEATTEPTTMKTTTVPTTVKKTTVPTTPRVLSEEELRKIFNLPLGVCFCSKFATVTRQCFPTALNKPCICRANFAGLRCEKCAPGYFNYPFCAPCRCNKQGSASLVCNQYTGRCSCKQGVRGRRCDECPVKSYGFPTCLACDCNLSGSYGGGAYCDPYTGQCPCRYGFRGRQCDKCPAGYYNFPNCQWCGCNPLTTISDICEDSADGYRCLCKPNYEGLFCGQCKKGYYGFPVCKRCTCSPRGYGSCNELGKCVCNDGYAGIQCDRCANGYYGFPNCRACNCNTFGSYSRQCNYTTGECSCKPDIRGIQCDRCAENMVGFPACIKCDCNADGTRFLPGFANGMCYGSAKYQCLCKSNVVGRTCDRCLHGFYNFSGSNPLGCTSCGCSHVGTVSGTRNCHAQNGRCECKNHVMGKKCQNCRDGYHGMKSHDIFGCKACKCDPGGSVRKNCFKHLGNCQCISGVRGKKCDSLYASRATYYPTLYHTYVELERAVLTSNTKIRVPIAADDDVFPSFSGVGYAIFPPHKEYAVVVAIPKTSKYHVIFHYALRNNQRSSAKVELYLRGSLLKPYNFEVQFPPRNPSEQQTKNLRLTVNKRGVNKEFELDKGAWTVAITSHSTMLLLDYIVFLPQDYYNADLLNDVQPGPCMLRTSKPEGCDMYTYYDPRSPSIVTVSGNRAYTHPFRRQAYLFTDTLYYLDEPKLSNMALLGESQPILGFDITVPESGPYVVMATYVHPERFIHRVSITIGNQRGTMEILPCKYQFLCRQFAMDGNKRPKNYELKARQTIGIKIESSASAKIGVSSVTVIPQAKWNIQYIEPRLLCRMVNKTCFPVTYPIPENAFQLVAFSHRTKDKMTSIFNGAVKAFVSYRIIIHYRQSNSLSKKVEELSITSHQKPNIPVTFHYCPADPGCRVVVGEEEALNFVFNRGIFTAKIQHERRTQLSYLLLVPQNFYSTSLLELQSSDKVTEFLQSCGKDHFHINPVRGRQCRQDVFSLTMRFIGGPLRCTCNVLGSRSSVCEEFGGQCLCRTNVVGRKCDRCKLGHAGFPRCRRCGCHMVGSVSPTCSTNGRCRCKPGFGGYKCDRCISSTYYGFPNCKPCACNTRGSLSTFCRSRDGQCQCRRNFNGKKCNECRIGYYDFPSCKKCSCEPAGIKLLPGEKNGCGSVDNTNCRCKDNVMGDKCDSCKPFHFNLRINNPLGCQSCGCNTNGSLGLIKTCHETTGQCLCKSHVTGRQCDQCKEGYYSIEGPNAFGCKRCSCNAGGSLSTSCNEITGQCPCLPGIGGNQCDRVKSNDYYYPTLHQYKVELEDAISTDNGRSAYSRYDESEFPGFSWRGYAVFSQSQTSIYMMIDVPRTSKYQLLFYYLLARYATVTALVRFTPTVNSALFPSGSATEQTLDVRFRATSNWFYRSADFLVVRDTWGDPQQIMLSQGKWKFTMSASATDLFVDYMVLLPEEYYKPNNLEVNVFSPCKLRGDDSHCSHLAFPSLKQDGFVTIQAEDSSVVGGVRRNRRVTDIPFHGLILTGSRNEMSFSLPSKVQGQFVLLASYFHDSDKEGVSGLVVKTGSEILRAQMSILSCRYRFGCRQVAIDKNHDVAIFTASQKEETTVSMTTSLTIALDFITAVPLAKWTQKLLLPATQCISNGFSCVQSTYFTPKDAVKVEAEDRLNGGDKAPYYIMDRRARLKHLKVGEKTLHINGRARTGRYYVIVHFYQPNFLSFLGKVVVSGQNAASTLLTFSYCPHVSGCRAIGTSQYREGMRESIYIGRQNEILVSIAIPEDKGVWIDYVLLVPISSFSPSLLDIKPIDITQDFIQDCGQRSFFLKESTSQFCLRSAFILTTRFNSGALSCNCDSLGATKTSCEPFGGQCVCRPNVIGRACDKCKSGYSGFPYCKR